jgi:hypothetical protein
LKVKLERTTGRRLLLDGHQLVTAGAAVGLG